MSYENAPATKMLATRCSVCSRPLVDSVSVELGIGPDCRRRHGYDIDVAPEIRAQANAIVHMIAVEQRGVAVAAGIRQLRDLGFTVLARRIGVRLFNVRIDSDGTEFVVTTPYTEAGVNAFRAVPGRRWDKDANANRFPKTSKPALWKALKQAFYGYEAMGPEGQVFAITQA
jgi:hypothetical protein